MRIGLRSSLHSSLCSGVPSIRLAVGLLIAGALAAAAPAWAHTQGWDWDEQGYLGPPPNLQPAPAGACTAAPLSQFVVAPLAASGSCAGAPSWG